MLSYIWHDKSTYTNDPSGSFILSPSHSNHFNHHCQFYVFIVFDIIETLLEYIRADNIYTRWIYLIFFDVSDDSIFYQFAKSIVTK